MNPALGDCSPRNGADFGGSRLLQVRKSGVERAYGSLGKGGGDPYLNERTWDGLHGARARCSENGFRETEITALSAVRMVAMPGITPRTARIGTPG